MKSFCVIYDFPPKASLRHEVVFLIRVMYGWVFIPNSEISLFRIHIEKSYLIKMISGRKLRNLLKLRDKSSSNYSTESIPYVFNKILLLNKMSRLEIEQYRQPHLTMTQLERDLKKRGMDYLKLLELHELNKDFQSRVQSCLEDFKLETKVVNRFNYLESNIDWCDAVISIGGDGTFLLAASKILDNKKPVIGFNSDPSRSEGHLCLPKKYSSNIKSAIEKILQGDFRWQLRTRIRVVLDGHGCSLTPVELHHPVQCLELSDITKNTRKSYRPDVIQLDEKRRPPFLALNDVFLGEIFAAKVSFFTMRINNSKNVTRVKSSGLYVCTGTGSTSWGMSMNRLNRQDISYIIELYNKAIGKSDCGDINVDIISSLCDRYNERFIFNPDDQRMSYTIRDLISVRVWPNPKGLIEPKNFVDSIEVHSKCNDGCVVLDGGLMFPFHEGTITNLETHSEDSLRTIILSE